jgi:hypothetical protein
MIEDIESKLRSFLMTKRITKGKNQKQPANPASRSDGSSNSPNREDKNPVFMGKFFALFDNVPTELVVGSGIVVTLATCWLASQNDMLVFACTAVASVAIWMALYFGLKQRGI